MPIKMILKKGNKLVRVYSINYSPNTSRTSALYWDDSEGAWHWTNLVNLSPLAIKEKKEEK